jgi:hypothetical protein
VRSRKSSRDAEKAALYEGFKGASDKQSGVFVFESMEERDRYQVAAYGHVRNGWREDDEPTDDRPPIRRDSCRCAGCLAYFGRDSETERMTYASAVEGNPRREDEGPISYIERINAIVDGKYEKLGLTMPRARLTRREMDARLRLLREQAERLKGGGA